VTTLVGRRQARVGIAGKARGVGEDGNAAHELQGYLYFDLEANYLSYLYVRGVHTLLDKAGQPAGKVEGSFTLTRTPLTRSAYLGDEALRGLPLEPDENNTLLLFENPRLGVRFLYPRNWRVAGSNPRGQIGLDENRGSGLLITLGPAAATPSAAEFVKEARETLAREKATVYRHDPPRSVQAGLDGFSFDVQMTDRRLTMQYYVTRQPGGGATLAAPLVARDLPAVQRDVERIARSLQITQPK
jgi:hypothetical protein